MTVPDPFDEGVPRDGRGRPLIIPAKRDGTPNLTGKPVAYTRASTFAKALDDGSGLTKWMVRHAVVGIANNPDLSAMIAAYGRDANLLEPEDKRNIDAIVERAHDRSGGNQKADYGTAVHALTEPGRDVFDDGDDDLRTSMLRDTAAYDALMSQLGFEVVATETFVVNDELKVAGTFDHTYRATRDVFDDNENSRTENQLHIPAGTIVVGDKKTGSLHLGQHAIQLATYARAKKYNHTTGERESLDASPTVGVVVHIPKGAGVAVAIVVDLVAGWKAAKLAGEVRAYRSTERRLGTKVAEASAPEDDSLDDLPTHMLVDPADDGEPVNVDEQPAPSRTVEATPERAEPAPPAEAVEGNFGDAIATLHRAGLEPTDVIAAEIDQASDAEDCRAIWHKYHNAGWDDARHVPLVKARLAIIEREKAA